MTELCKVSSAERVPWLPSTLNSCPIARFLDARIAILLNQAIQPRRSAAMADYEPLDISAWCNAPLDALEAEEEPVAGRTDIPGPAFPRRRPGGPGRRRAVRHHPHRQACAPDHLRAHPARNDSGRGRALGPARRRLRVQDRGRHQRVRADQGAVRDRRGARSGHGARGPHLPVQGGLGQPA